MSPGINTTRQRPLRAARHVSSQPIVTGQTSPHCTQYRCRSSSPRISNMERKTHNHSSSTGTENENRPNGDTGSVSESQQPLGDPTESFTAIICQLCGTENLRKRHIKCNSCGQYWHLTCSHLKRREADVLLCWWCLRCASIVKPCGELSLQPCDSES